MLSKLFNLCLHPLGSGSKTLQQGSADNVGAFYRALSEGLKKLELSLGPDSEPSFSLDWLCLALDFVHSLHSNVIALLEELWIPRRATFGVEVLNMYLDVSTRLLGLCNYLKDALGQLESYQMSLEHAVSTLASALKSLSVHDDSGASWSLQTGRNELERIDSTRSALLTDLVSKLDQSSGVSRGGDVKKRKLSLRRSQSLLPSFSSVDKKAFDISLILADFMVVTEFMACLLLWVLSGSSQEFFKSAGNLDSRGTAGAGEVAWSASLSRLRERVKDAQSKDAVGKIFHQIKYLKEVEDVRVSIFALQEKVEADWGSTSREDWLEETKAMLEETRGRLTHILHTTERLGVNVNATFSEILSSRKRLLDFVESQLMRSPTL